MTPRSLGLLYDILFAYFVVEAKSKMDYVTLIGLAGLSSKEKPLKHCRGRNFDWIVSKFHTHVGLIKLKILCEN